MASPVVSPVISQGWGRPNPRYKCGRHTGADFACKVGTKAIAVADGKVLRTFWDNAYGNVLILQPTYDGVPLEIWYCHLSAFKVKAGATVKAGDLVALTGNTGNSTGPHLHLETRVAPFRYGCDVANPFLDVAGVIDPKAPKDRRITLRQKAAAVWAPAKPEVTKQVRLSNVEVGDLSEDMKLVQAALNDLTGAGLKITGQYDQATVEAYRHWQEQLGYHGADADGVAGIKSLTAMGQKYGFKVVK